MTPIPERPRSARPPRPLAATAAAPLAARVATRIAAALALIAALLASNVAAAQVVVNPQAIVVNPAPAFGVQVWLDRDPGGNGQPVYQIGDPVTITVRVDRTAYIYLFDVRPDGRITQILPNRLSGGQSNRIQSGQAITFPPPGAPYVFEMDGPFGLSKVIAVASVEPLDTNALASFRSGESFATSGIGQEGFADAFSIVVRPVPQNEWVTDTALYVVGGVVATPPPPPAPAPGPVVWNDPLVRLPAGSELLDLDRRNRRTDAEFRSAFGLDTLYDDLHRQIRNGGWTRTELRTRSGEIRAEYSFGRERIELRLEREGGGRYDLRIQRRGNDDD